MKKVLLSGGLLVCWLIFLSVDIPVGDRFFPSAGRFFNPFEGIWQNVHPRMASSAFIAPLKGEVRILFDERDVPHVYAHNVEDALYAQGYLHAANRLFSMDLSTRAAAGRLSEWIGPRTISHDHMQRERGIGKAASEKAKAWESYPEVKPFIDSYVKGVNAFIESLDYKSLPLEYKILSCAPELWTSERTALMVMNMALMLCISEHDVDYSKAKALLSPEEFQFLYPEHNTLESPIIPADHQWDFSSVLPFNTNIEVDPPAVHVKIPRDKNENIHGSNNWAIAPQHTANGFAILANDPHLSLTLPNIWYEMEIHTPEMSVHGVSIPGLPYIVVGFNEHIAWGTTNSGQDVLDWYQIRWKDSSRHEYLLDGQYEKSILRPEIIKVRGSKSLTDTVRYTHWGPVSSLDDHRDMAMKWIVHQKIRDNDVAYLQKINKAKNVAEYRDAVESFHFPAQNKIFASVEGDIAITVAGTMPLRNPGEGVFVMDGSFTKNDWRGFIPFSHAPFVINPPRGYVSSANQAPAATNYPYPMPGNRTFEDYRGRVINAILDTSSSVSVRDMMELQQNNLNLQAAELLPLLLETLKQQSCLTDEEKLYMLPLEKWNYQYHRDSLSPVLYDLWYNAFEKLTFDELDSSGLMYPEDWRIIELVSAPDRHDYFDIQITTEKDEHLGDIVCLSFAEMVKSFLALEGESSKNWGNYKASEIPHLARMAPFGVSFLRTSGGKHIVNAMGKNHGPSWRMIVELSSPPRAFVNIPGGESGDPASPHYKDMLDQFFEGHYYEVSLRKDPATWKAVREINIHPQ
jgi:penicillin amidase